MKLKNTTSQHLVQSLENEIENTISLNASSCIEYPHIKQSFSSNSHELTVEGSVRKRYFPVPDSLDLLEEHTQKLYGSLFGFSFVDVRPMTATHANMAVFMALLSPGDKIVSLGLNDGGHLSHGHSKSFLGRYYEVVHYGVQANGKVDLSQLEDIIIKVRPKLVISGGSSCPRTVEHSKIAELAHAYGAYHMADISHTAGLIASGFMTNNLGECDVVTFGGQKTFLGPRGGILMAKGYLSKKFMSAIFPGVEGAMNLPQLIAKAMAGEFAKTEVFKKTSKRIVFLAKLLAEKMTKKGIDVVTNGTDSHIVLIDVPNSKKIVSDLYQAGIRVNANPVPNTDRWGIRFGTISLAQCIMSDERIDCFLEVLTNYIVDNSQLNLEKVKSITKEIIRRKEHELPIKNAGQWSDELTEELRNDLTSKSLIRKRIKTENKGVLIHTKPELYKSCLLRESNIGIVIPTVGTEKDTLWKVAKYAQKMCPKGKIIIVNKTSVDKSIEKHGNIYHAPLSVLNQTNLNFDMFMSEHSISEDNYGKGWSMRMGSLALINSSDHLFYLDSDLEDIEEYDPLGKLAFGIESGKDVQHALIATPGRRNEVIHGVLHSLQGSHFNMDETINRLKSIIHPLAGERYINKKTLMSIPWATNYGIETVWNSYTSFLNLNTCQISNDLREDGINSYVKNEVMLMYCSKLLSLIVQGCSVKNDFFENIENFNHTIQKFNIVTILPNISEQEIQTFLLNTDYFLPSIKQMIEKNLVKKKFIL